MYTLSNKTLLITIASKGAELQNLYNKKTQIEYLWSGDSDFWGKKSPVLFPIVGGLKNNSYRYKEVNYTLPRHGFARECIFAVTDQTNDSITFTLEENVETLKVYPFCFRFSINYTIHENTLTVNYLVENTGNDFLFFSVGAHPAFAVPLEKNVDFSDYHLLFNEFENSGRWPLTKDGLLLKYPIEFLNNSNTLFLSKDLFFNDALVFKNLSSNNISILSKKSKHGLQVTFDGFPYMGIWSAKNANFVCIEPWCGVADSEDVSGELTEKEGIHVLAKNEIFTRSWSVKVC